MGTAEKDGDIALGSMVVAIANLSQQEPPTTRFKAPKTLAPQPRGD